MRKKHRDAGHLLNYSVYELNGKERCMAFILAFFTVFAAFYIMYSVLWLAIPGGLIAGFIFIPYASGILAKRRKRKLLMQFRDMLDSLYGSFSSGKNLYESVCDMSDDLIKLHGQKSMIYSESEVLRDGLKNGKRIEEMFYDFAVRSDLDEIRTFADSLKAGNRSGGNLRKTVSDCKEIIGDRIATERQIEAQIAKNRAELYILSGMPFLAVTVMRLLGNEIYPADTLSGFAVKTVALIIFGSAVFIGKKISDVKA